MSIYDSVRTDPVLEQQGVVLDYGKFRVTVARAGGANKRYQQVLEAKSKPYRRAIQGESLDPNVGLRILREVYVEAVIQKWEVNTGTDETPNWQSGVDVDQDGRVVPATKENMLRTLGDQSLEFIFEDMQQQAAKAALFRAHVQEVQAKN